MNLLIVISFYVLLIFICLYLISKGLFLMSYKLTIISNDWTVKN